MPIRLFGSSLSHLVSSQIESKLSLLLDDEVSRKKRELNTAVDSIYEKVGVTRLPGQAPLWPSNDTTEGVNGETVSFFSEITLECGLL